VRDIPGEMEFYIHNTATPTKRVVKFTADGTMTMITRVYDPLGRTGTGSGNWIDTTDFDEKKFNASQDFQALVTSATNLSAHFTQCVNSRRADLETAMDDNDLMQHHIE